MERWICYNWRLLAAVLAWGSTKTAFRIVGQLVRSLSVHCHLPSVARAQGREHTGNVRNTRILESYC